MSLVDYASSSDEDDDVLEAEEQEHEPQPPPQQQQQEQNPSLPPVINQRSESSTPPAAVPLPPIEKLPDASMLLNASSFSSVTGTDHASRVAAAMATRNKRDSNGLGVTSSTLLPRSKVAKGGNLPHPKNVFDTAGGLLVPPQLSGRSNVVTEDISKLFVKRQAESPSQ